MREKFLGLGSFLEFGLLFGKIAMKQLRAIGGLSFLGEVLHVETTSSLNDA